jgi:hypothetical protein
VASGAATACSKATTLTPARGKAENSAASSFQALRFYQGQRRQRESRYDGDVSEETPRGENGHWRRREQRRRSERQRQQKHGAGLRRVYRDAILKRLRARKKS